MTDSFSAAIWRVPGSGVCGDQRRPDMSVPTTHREFFDALAPSWEDRIGPPARAAVSAIVVAMKLSPGACVLDLGTGTGIAIPALRQSIGSGARIIALDISHSMLEEARSRHGQVNVAYVQADGGGLPFVEQAFDAILCNATFPHFRDKVGALREMRRVLRPGGEIHITHLAGRERTNAIHRNAGGVIGNDRVPAAREMRTMLEAAGFAAVSVVDEPVRYVAVGRRPGREEMAPSSRSLISRLGRGD